MIIYSSLLYNLLIGDYNTSIWQEINTSWTLLLMFKKIQIQYVILEIQKRYDEM